MSATVVDRLTDVVFLKRRFVPHRLAAAAAMTACAAGLMLTPSVPAAADPVNLEGSWSGGGTVTFPAGAKENARCRASFKKKTGATYSINARCASASGKVEQSAILTQLNENTFSGSFFNNEYKVDGTINVTVKGNVQNVSVVSPAGASAYFRMSR